MLPVVHPGLDGHMVLRETCKPVVSNPGNPGGNPPRIPFNSILAVDPERVSSHSWLLMKELHGNQSSRSRMAASPRPTAACAPRTMREGKQAEFLGVLHALVTSPWMLYRCITNRGKGLNRRT
jgi:hypothetical protein